MFQTSSQTTQSEHQVADRGLAAPSDRSLARSFAHRPDASVPRVATRDKQRRQSRKAARGGDPEIHFAQKRLVAQVDQSATMVDEGWTTVEKKAPTGTGRASGGGRTDQAARSSASRMNGQSRTHPPRPRATFLSAAPFLPGVANPPRRPTIDLVAEARAVPAPRRAKARSRPRRNPASSIAPFPRDPSTDSFADSFIPPTPAPQATVERMDQARALGPAAGRGRTPAEAPGARASARPAATARRAAASAVISRRAPAA